MSFFLFTKFSLYIIGKTVQSSVVITLLPISVLHCKVCIILQVLGRAGKEEEYIQ